MEWDFDGTNQAVNLGGRRYCIKKSYPLNHRFFAKQQFKASITVEDNLFENCLWVNKTVDWDIDGGDQDGCSGQENDFEGPESSILMTIFGNFCLTVIKGNKES